MTTHTYYMYAPKKTLPSIKQHGYLSVLAQKKTFGSLNNEVINKYKDQMEDAKKEYDELATLLKGKSMEDQILEYLDWRMKGEIPANRRGSNAIYILYYPIPNEEDIIEFVKKKRKFATDRILLSGKTTATFYPIPSNEALTPEEYMDRSFWVKKWRAQMKKNVENALWLDGIPHACFFPTGGHIDFYNMSVEKELFQ